jgi:hypothetical protein
MGILLQWTAATDATNESVYEIYVLQDVLSHSPSWNLVGQGLPYVVPSTSPGTSAPVFLTVVAPATDFTFSQSSIDAIMGPGSTVAPDSLAFSIIHVDATGASSTALSVSAFKPSQNVTYGVPHFKNEVSLDSFGQFRVNPQDSYGDIASNAEMFLGTLPGQRDMVPDYGVPDLPFSELDIIKITNDLNFYDDRANAIISVQVDDYDNATLSVKVQGGQGGV